jgi:chromosome segregation ATPase
LEEVRSQLVEADRLLVRKNQEIQAMGGVLAEANRKLADRDDEIQQLESKIQNLESQIAGRDAEIAAVAADRADLAQFKKEAKEAAAEVHREGMAIKGLEIQWQQRLSDANSELADAKAVILKQNDKIRELERGFSFKPSPADAATMKAQRLEIEDLRSQLSDLQQNSAPAIKLPEPANLLNQLKARRKKSTATLADVEKLLEILEEGNNEPD